MTPVPTITRSDLAIVNDPSFTEEQATGLFFRFFPPFAPLMVQVFEDEIRQNKPAKDAFWGTLTRLQNDINPD